VKPLLRTSADGVTRCSWCGDDPLYVAYHDREWGRPVRADVRLFEKVCLEGFQSGLSWLTILRKRENFRRAFAGFDMDRVARFGKRDVARLLADEGIVRHRGKIESAIHNAECALALVEEHGSLARYFAQYRADRPFAGWVAVSDESKALSKDLRKRGWSYVGPTTMYAFLQAVGLVNDHAEGCDFRAEVERERMGRAKRTSASPGTPPRSSRRRTRARASG
jgi:DNA-3-methyladenine glycosylase I